MSLRHVYLQNTDIQCVCVGVGVCVSHTHTHTHTKRCLRVVLSLLKHTNAITLTRDDKIMFRASQTCPFFSQDFIPQLYGPNPRKYDNFILDERPDSPEEPGFLMNTLAQIATTKGHS